MGGGGFVSCAFRMDGPMEGREFLWGTNATVGGGAWA
jgi:hypothetical protein